jgi:hypothetical protein
MPGPGLGQPDIAGALVVTMDDVTAVETGGIAPSAIVNVPNSFTLNTKFTFKDALAGLLEGEEFDVEHHVQRLEDGATSTLAGGSVTAGPVVGGQIEINYVSTSFTTGTAGSGANFEIPAGAETEATFRVLTQLIPKDAAVRKIVAAFHDGLLLQVIE